MNFHRLCFSYLIYRVTGFLLIALTLDSIGAIAETSGLPILTRVVMRASVTLQPSGIYEYRYIVQNLADTQAELWGVSIDITYPPNSAPLSEEGLENGRGFAVETSKIGPLLFPSTPPMIPVGLSAPIDWTVGLAHNGTADWGSGHNSKVKPNQFLDGFLIQSHGLPGIRSFQADPWIDVDALYPSIETLSTQEELDALGKRIKDDKQMAAFKGKTLGPTAPPADFQPLAFLSYIAGLKEESVTLGWITNAGVANSLDVKLNAAKRALERGDTKTAKNILNALIKEVEAQTDKKFLTPEAIALLKFNTEFLIRKLP